MTWFKVDDGFWSHPKTVTLSDAAVALWVRAGSYSCQHLTDGEISASVLRMVGTEQAAEELVGLNLWVTEPGGWRFHDWDEYQETSVTVKKRRDDARERQRRAREIREAKRRESQGESRVTDAVSSLPPTRPDPTRPSVSKETEDSSSEVANATTRPDIQHLLDLLDAEIISNGGKAPSRTKKNHDAMRLLLDKDGRTVDQVERAIRWCQADEFWRSNILSASKLREKYDQLRLAAERKRGPSKSWAQQRDENAIAIVNQYRETGNGQGADGATAHLRALDAGR